VSVYLFGFLPDQFDHARVDGKRRLFAAVAPRHPAEEFPEHLHQLVVIQVPRRRDDDVVAAVHVLLVGEDAVAGKAPDAFGVAEDGHAERVPGPEMLVEEIVDQVVGGVLHHVDLLEHDTALLLDLFGIEGGVQEDGGAGVDGTGERKGAG